MGTTARLDLTSHWKTGLGLLAFLAVACGSQPQDAASRTSGAAAGRESPVASRTAAPSAAPGASTTPTATSGARRAGGPDSNPRIQPFSSYTTRYLAGTHRIRVSPDQSSIELVFPVETPDPNSFVGVRLTYETIPGQTYEFKTTISDNYGGNHPGRFEQQVYIGDRLVWRHDLGRGTFRGSQDVRERFTATGERTDIRIDVRVVGSIEPWGWADATRTRVNGYELTPVH